MKTPNALSGAEFRIRFTSLDQSCRPCVKFQRRRNGGHVENTWGHQRLFIIITNICSVKFEQNTANAQSAIKQNVLNSLTNFIYQNCYFVNLWTNKLEFLSYILWAQQSVSAGYGQPLACAVVLQSMPVSCHFRGCKAPLSRIVSGAISSELALPFTKVQL